MEGWGHETHKDRTQGSPAPAGEIKEIFSINSQGAGLYFRAVTFLLESWFCAPLRAGLFLFLTAAGFMSLSAILYQPHQEARVIPRVRDVQPASHWNKGAAAAQV